MLRFLSPDMFMLCILFPFGSKQKPCTIVITKMFFCLDFLFVLVFSLFMRLQHKHGILFTLHFILLGTLINVFDIWHWLSCNYFDIDWVVIIFLIHRFLHSGYHRRGEAWGGLLPRASTCLQTCDQAGAATQGINSK